MYSDAEMKKMFQSNVSIPLKWCNSHEWGAQDRFLKQHATPECIPNVLSIPAAFYHASCENDSYSLKMYTPKTILKERLYAPIKTAFNNGRMHFFSRYESVNSCFDGFCSLAGHAHMLVFSLFSELLLSLSYLIKAGSALADNKRSKAKEYILTAASHFILVPSMAMVAAINVPMEIMRFFTRSITTLINLCKTCTNVENEGKMRVLKSI